MIRILILGTGNMANTHANAFKAEKGVKLVATVETNAERREAFAKAHGIAESFASLDEALAWGAFDAASNVTPDAVHHPTTMKLIAAGNTRAIALSSAGNGSPGHLAAQVLSDATGMRINPIFYRGNTPAVTAVVQVLQKSILDALKRPEVQTRMSSLDLRFEGLTGAAAHERMAALSARYARVVQATDMKVE